MAEPDDKTPPAAPAPDDDAPVPRLGRGRRRKGSLAYYFPPNQIITLFALVVGLVAVVSLRESCAHGAGNLIKAFDNPDAGAAAAPPSPAPAP